MYFWDILKTLVVRLLTFLAGLLQVPLSSPTGGKAHKENIHFMHQQTSSIKSYREGTFDYTQENIVL